MVTLPPESPTHTTTHPVSHFLQTTLSYDSNVMLAAIISLLVVILFVLLLHLYARWFLVQARQRSRSSVTVPHVLGSRFTIIDTTSSHDHDHDHPSKSGLPASLISSLPTFVYHATNNPKIDSHGDLVECAVCISLFEEDEVGRRLPKCGHAFHVECIDMWLHSHSTCPICRAGVVCLQTAAMNYVDHADSLPEILQLRAENVHLEIDEDCPNTTENADLVSLSGSLRRILSSSRVERKVHPSVANSTQLILSPNHVESAV